MRDPAPGDLREARIVEISFAALAAVGVAFGLPVGFGIVGLLTRPPRPWWDPVFQTVPWMAAALGAGVLVAIFVRARRRGL